MDTVSYFFSEKDSIFEKKRAEVSGNVEVKVEDMRLRCYTG